MRRLVGDFDGQARRLVSHCGVDWDERCLAFHETKRPVHTASFVQVRKPIYASSVGRSGLYGSRLEPLLQALESDRVAPGPEAQDLRAAPQQQTAAEPATADRSARGADPADAKSAAAESATPDPGTAKPDVSKPEAWTELAFEVAKKLQERRDFANAERLFTLVLALRPAHYGSLLGLGSIRAIANRLDEAKTLPHAGDRG